MKLRFSALATAMLVGLPVLFLTSCDSIKNGDNPYFGVRDKSKRWVPKELQEDRYDTDDDEYYDSSE